MSGERVNVFLVGAGPGDPGLITKRGLDLIRTGDVILYDRLVATSLLDEAREDAEAIFVGKTPGQTSMPQAAIDALVVEKARQGKLVVRLKGGDPFVFGRGADEAQALAAAGISFEIVPGVSAAVAVPGYAGIPLTHGGVSSSFAVLTGHETAPRPGAEERFAAIAAGAETLVLLMGAASLEDTAARLIAAGRSPDEPVALVERGTTPAQRTIVATLGTVGEVARQEEVEAPVTTVVGPVVNLRTALDWFETRLLFGRRIVVTRARAQAGPLIAALEDLGAEVVATPTIRIVDPPSLDALDAAIERLQQGHYSWVLFASVNAVERFFTRLGRSYDSRALARTKVAAVGPATAERLRGYGIKEDVLPATFTAMAAIEALGRADGRILLPRPSGAPPGPTEALRDEGWEVDEVVTYQTLRVRPDARLFADRIDAVAFTSASSVEGFADVTRSGDRQAYAVVCIGPSTADRARELGLTVDAVADPHTMDGLVEALVQKLGRPPRGTMGR
ncbi:MAG TPA: uroporphyrinogen-III C-methyltransferase [Actinomycetota bacterium]|nr:uroporphyrinogen-III C-methyltransferase [Actinomycetota bacterium]